MRKKSGLGVGFADMVGAAEVLTRKNARLNPGQRHEISDLMFISPSDDEPAQLSIWRFVPVKLVVIGCVLLLSLRLFHLQVVQGVSNKQRSDNNRVITQTIHAARGVIYDRNHEPLVNNSPAFVALIGDKAKVISHEEALAIEASSSATNTVEVQVIRNYPFGEALAHILGYTSEITKEELDKDQNRSMYALGDRIGRAGLEQSYESYLHGIDGATLVEVDALNRPSRTIGTKEPTQGHNITLALDANLQKQAYASLKNALPKAKSPAGVVVAQDPRTGGILAMVSIPSYDNNVFSRTLSDDDYQSLINNPSHPLYNRAIGGIYPPGSLYKMVTSMAGLLSHKIDGQTQIEDTGVVRLGEYTFANWLWTKRGQTDGLVNLEKALARSNDIYFYRLGEMVGNDFLADIAKQLGLGRLTGIDLPSEEEGLVPTSAWKEKTQNEIWYPGDTFHMAIGQGYNLTTPLQLNQLTSYIANNGVAYQPHLVMAISDQRDHEIKKIEPKIQLQNIGSKTDLALIRSGLKAACTTGGTGWPFFDFGIKQFERSPYATEAAQVIRKIPVGCKTGTAEFGTEGKTHAWFTVFAPFDNPEIVVTVLLEGGGEGSDVAAPVAREILDYYFNPKL